MFGILDNMSPLGQLMPKLYMSFADDAGDLTGDGAPEDIQSQPEPEPAPEPAPAPQPEPAKPASWKSALPEDIAKSPLVQGFEDNPEGLKKIIASHLNLEKLLGHEKVPLPKGPDDAEGIARFNKALGVPDTAEGYNLESVTLPEELNSITFDKAKFSEIARENNLTPTQASGLWKTYTDMMGKTYQEQVNKHKADMAERANKLRSEWGDTYAANIELGEMVVAKFADDQNMADFITAALSKDPAGQKFLAKIGTQFAENKVGDFQYKRHALTAEEAQAEADKIMADMNHPYNNAKASEKEHLAAVEHVNRLIAISMKKPG